MTVSDVFLTIMPINHIIKFANISVKLTGGKIFEIYAVNTVLSTGAHVFSGLVLMRKLSFIKK